MNAVNPWPAAIARLATVLAIFGVLGWLVGYAGLGLFAGTFLYLLWHLHNMARLDGWLRAGIQVKPPESRGVWGEIFNGIYRRQRQHRQRRQYLANLLSRGRESINAMPDAAVVLGTHGEIQWWNGPAKEMLGLRWPQDRGQRLDNLLRNPEFSGFLAGKLPGRESITVSSPVDRSRIVEVRLAPYQDGQRLLLGRDVTRLNRLERMRRDFVANISHELRTPLTVIQGLAETLTDDQRPSDEEWRQSMDMILQQADRIRRLVDDLLLLSRLETDSKPAKATVVDVPRLLERLVQEARAVSGAARHEIVVDAQAGLCLRGEEGELRSAFSNLIFNAVKYTPAGGRIGVRWWSDDAGAHFSVTDTGDGIPPHHLSRLTERFYRVDAGRSSGSGGVGLGLAIVKHVLSRHHSRLAISSRVGEGSTFACGFPADEVVHRQPANEPASP